MSDNIVLANTTSTTTIRSLRLKVNEVIGVVNQIGRDEHTYLEVTNANAKFATKAYAASNAYVKTILANTNAYIATRASWSALTSTNTSIRNYVDSKIVANTSQLVNGTYNLTLQANSALRLPSGAKLISGYPGFGQYLSNFATLAGDYVYLSSANGYSYIGYENSTITLAHGPNIWSFDIDGTIRFPDNTIQSTAYTGSAAYLQVANANAKFATKAYAASNTAVRSLISDRLQVANAAATYQTKTVERAALANTNAYIVTRASWAGLTGTNTALRILINDRIQVANVAAKYATKAYAASNAYVKLLLANTNAYIADVAASSGGGGGFSAEALDYGFITSSVDVETSRDYGTL
jgi:hypothetical protein